MRPLFHFFPLQKYLQYTEKLFVIRKSGDIFAVLKGAREAGWGAGAPEEGRQWDHIPVLTYAIEKRSSSRDY